MGTNITDVYTSMVEHKTITRTDNAETMPLKVITLPDGITPIHLELYQQCMEIDIYNSASIKLLSCLIRNADKQGIVKMSQVALSQQADISLTTTARLIIKFQDMTPPILTKLSDCLYQLNEQVISMRDLTQPHCIIYRHVSDASLPENMNIGITITDNATQI